MKSIRTCVFAATMISGAALAGPPPAALVQQLNQQYPPGTVVTVKLKGLLGVFAQCAVAPATAFKDGKLHRMGLLQTSMAVSGQCASRAMPVGSSLTVSGTLVQDRFNRIDFLVQDPNDGYKSQVWFEFPKGSLATIDFKVVQTAIDTLFGLQAAAPEQQAQQPQQQAPQGPPPAQPPPQQQPPAAPSLGPIYVNSQIAGDRLQLNPGGSFSLTEGGQAFSGTYSINGSNLKLHIVQLDRDVDITIDGDKLIVNGSEVWVQPK